MAGLFHVPLVRTNHAALQRWAVDSDVALVGMSADASLLWTNLPPLPRIALLVGTERTGLSAAGRAMCHITVRIPMLGRADSLNVATATGIMLYELLRREALAK